MKICRNAVKDCSVEKGHGVQGNVDTLEAHHYERDSADRRLCGQYSFIPSAAPPDPRACKTIPGCRALQQEDRIA